jgi:RND family efflux transporter MFP subunit
MPDRDGNRASSSTTANRLAWLVALVLAGFCGWLAHGLLGGSRVDPEEAESPPPEPAAMAVEVQVARAVTGNLPVTVVSDATVILPPEAAATISSRASGRVAEVLVVPGQQVNAGDLLLKFERGPLEAAVLRARSDRERAQSELLEFERGGREGTLVELRTGVEHARADRDLAEAQKKRLEALHEEGLVSDKAVAEAQTAHAQSQRELSKAEKSLAVFESSGADLKRSTEQAQVDAAAAALADAERQLAEADVVAIADGTVATLSARRGDHLEAGVVLGTLVTGSARLLSCPLTARDAARVTVGATATAFVPGAEIHKQHADDDHSRFDAVPGTVERIMPVASVSGLVEVIVQAQAASIALRPGVLMRVEIQVDELHDVTLVPEAAVVRAADKEVVALVDDGDLARITEVHVLGRHGDLAAIAGQVKANQRVITAGGYNLPDGAHVVPHASAGEPAQGGS